MRKLREVLFFCASYKLQIFREFQQYFDKAVAGLPSIV